MNTPAPRCASKGIEGMFGPDLERRRVEKARETLVHIRGLSRTSLALLGAGYPEYHEMRSEAGKNIGMARAMIEGAEKYLNDAVEAWDLARRPAER